MSTFLRARSLRLSLASAALIPALLGGFAPAATAFAVAPWPQFHGDARHAGVGTSAGPRELTLDWYVSSGADVNGGPVIATDGSVYFVAADGNLFGLSPEGGQRWKVAIGAVVLGSVAMTPDERFLLVGDARGRLHAYATEDGSRVWTITGYGSIRATPVISPEGFIYFGTDQGDLVGLDTDRKERFRIRAEGDIIGSPSLAPNGDIYWTSRDGKLRRANKNGSLLWAVAAVPQANAATGSRIEGSAAIGGDGTVVLGAGTDIVAFDGDNGGIKWRVGTGGVVYATPAIAPDGTVYVGSEAGGFHAIAPNGTLKWVMQVGAAVRSSAVVSTDGLIYFGAGNSLFYAVDSNGKQLSTYRAFDAIHGAAAMDGRGNVYAGSLDNRLYAFRENARRFAESPADRLGGDLVRDRASGKVYVIVLGKRRHIPDATTQLLLGLPTGIPAALTEVEALRYPEGAPLPALAEGTLLRATNGPLYAISSGKRVWIKSEEEFAAGGYSWESLAQADDQTVRSVPLAFEPGMLVKGGGDRIYVVEDGRRRWVSTAEAFAARGYAWNNVHFVSEALLQTVPEGDRIG